MKEFMKLTENNLLLINIQGPLDAIKHFQYSDLPFEQQIPAANTAACRLSVSMFMFCWKTKSPAYTTDFRCLPQFKVVCGDIRESEGGIPFD